MSVNALLPVGPELLLFALAVVVILLGALGWRRLAGPLTMVGFIAAFAATFLVSEGAFVFNDLYEQDALALFMKRLFIGSAAISLLGSMTLTHRAFRDRSAEYHFALIVSVLGMSV